LAKFDPKLATIVEFTFEKKNKNSQFLCRKMAIFRQQKNTRLAIIIKSVSTWYTICWVPLWVIPVPLWVLPDPLPKRTNNKECCSYVVVGNTR
jgi:hypothetical protein